MDYKLVLRPRAENNLAESIEWYENQQQGLGTRFLSSIEEYLAKICEEPFLFHIRRTSYREAVVKKFPYVIIYEVKEAEVVVHAVFNTYRNLDAKP